MTTQDQCRVCPYRFDLCTKLEHVPFYREFGIAKSSMPDLPVCFEVTTLGEPKGALRQYRGPNNSHVHEYPDVWILHRDKVDPRIDPVGHLLFDAPYVLVAGLIALVFLGTVLSYSEDE